MTGPTSLHRNLGRAHGFEALEVEGTIPEGLAGTLYRVGPGIFERFGARVSHPFEADGVISAVRIDGSDPQAGARGAAQVIQSTGYQEEQAAGRRLYGSGAARLRRLRNNFTQRSKNTSNTSAWIWNQQLFALMEGGKPTQLDPETLAVLGEREFDGVVAKTFSAHPHRVASLATSFNFGIRFAKVTTLDLFALPDAGPVRKIGTVELPWATLVHDFVATPTHLLFVICPAKLVLWRALLGVGGFSELFKWTPSLGCTLIVVPIAEPERAQPIPCEPYWVWHFANGFRRGDDLVFDLCRYADFSTLEAIGHTAELTVPPIYHRAVLELRTGRLRNEPALDGAAEFPRVHPAVEGQAHRYAWIRRGVAPLGAPPNERMARFEVETGRLREWVPEQPLHLSEAVLVPREPLSAGQARDEAAVWALVMCHDPRRDRSFIAILDGRAPDDGPVAKLWFDHPLPESFHGTWLGAQP